MSALSPIGTPARRRNNKRELVVGVLVFGVLVAGWFVTGGSCDQTAGTSKAGPFLDISNRDGRLRLGDLEVSVSAGPRPLRPLAGFAFESRVLHNGQPAAIENPRLSWRMKMDMGPHNFRLTKGEGGRWLAEEIVLPKCASGQRLWFADLSFLWAGQTQTVRLRLELATPAAD